MDTKTLADRDKGYVIFTRRLIDYANSSPEGRLFFYLVGTARHSKCKFSVCNPYTHTNSEITLERGQIVAYVNRLSEYLSISPSSVRRIMQKLEAQELIKIEKVEGCNLVTINGYDTLTKYKKKGSSESKEITESDTSDDNEITESEDKVDHSDTRLWA
jgi:DNA-binding transcriptional regulator YhcF (GntR family)